MCLICIIFREKCFNFLYAEPQVDQGVYCFQDIETIFTIIYKYIVLDNVVDTILISNNTIIQNLYSDLPRSDYLKYSQSPTTPFPFNPDQKIGNYLRVAYVFNNDDYVIDFVQNVDDNGSLSSITMVLLNVLINEVSYGQINF